MKEEINEACLRELFQEMDKDNLGKILQEEKLRVIERDPRAFRRMFLCEFVEPKKDAD
jgi:hypothetical protein